MSYVVVPQSASVDGVTIDTNASGEIQIKDGGVTGNKLNYAYKTRKLLETLTPTADSTITTSTLEAFDEYEVEAILEGNTYTSLRMQINGLTTSIYRSLFFWGTTTTDSTNTYVILGDCHTGSKTKLKMSIPGVAGSDGSINAQIQCGEVAYKRGISFKADIGSSGEQITTLNFLTSTGNITGTIKIYGVE